MALNSSEQTAQILWTPMQRTGTSITSRRAGVACAFCRARKVKCNRVGHQPCTNCVFENVQCMLLPKQRRHRRANQTTKRSRPGVPDNAAQSLAASSGQSPEPTDVQAQSSSLHFYEDSAQERPKRPEPQTSSEASAPLDCDGRSDQDIDEDIDWRGAAVEAVPVRPLNPSISPVLNPPYPDAGTGLVAPSVPYFIKGPPSCLGKQDLDYLARKGALDIPEAELRDALIECYVHFIHPCYPILDIDILEEAILGDAAQPFSLSVFQAVMFAASSWVDVKLLRKLGYLSRWAARQALYSKVRLLYDADYEQDEVCQLQTLVLLSLWWKAPNEAKDGWHWLGLAVSLARTMGLHQEATYKHLDTKAGGLRRRLWWSCTIRDTFTSFSSNRVPRISDADFTVTPLTLHDFQWQKERNAQPRGLGTQSLDVQKQLAAICIQTAAICRIITRVLLAAYHETPTGNIDILYCNSVPDEGRSYIEPTKLQDIEEAFRTWQIETPSDVSHLSPISLPSSRSEQAPLVHRALMSILYHTGLIMFHRQRRPASSPDGGPRELVRDAARQVNKIIMDMYITDLMKDMPPTVISLLLPVSMSHILDMKSKEPLLREKGNQRLEECKQALRELCDGHLAAEWAVNFLTHAASKIKAQVRAMKSLSTTTNPRTSSNLEEPSTIRQNGLEQGQQQVHGEGWMSAQSPPTLFSGSSHVSMSHLQSTQSAFMPNLGDSTAADIPFDWNDLPILQPGFFDAQWNATNVDQLEQYAMSMDL